MEALKTSNFLWIDASASNHLPGGGLRRREVMQKLALRRKREPKQLHPNSRQLPVFIQSNDGAESSRDQMVGTTGHVSLDMPGRRIGDGAASSLPPSLTTVHLAPVHPTMLVKANLDFVDLCSLASLEVGRYTGHRFLKQPHSIAFYLGGTTWSYCRYVPSLYSQSLLVRTAADCAIARVKCLLKPDDTGWEVLAITSYSNAISVLQKAINDNVSQHPSAEVLCSTQILSLYELLNPHRENAWRKHAAGAALIIKLRGPESYVSEFEKSLFLSHIGPIITEAILENQSCFLEEPAWVAALQSIITDDSLVPERSTALISLIVILVTLPRLFRDFTNAIYNRCESSPSAEMELMNRAQNLRKALKNWYSTHVDPKNAPIIGTNLNDGLYKLVVLFYLCSIYSNRLSTCIHWTGTRGMEGIEDECQQLSKNIVLLCEGDGNSSLKSCLILAQKLPIATATIKTSEE